MGIVELHEAVCQRRQQAALHVLVWSIRYNNDHTFDDLHESVRSIFAIDGLTESVVDLSDHDSEARRHGGER